MQLNSDENQAVEDIAETRASFGEPSWYALTIRSRQERHASMALESLGVMHFLPVIDEEHQWSDRRKMITVPLFPGYLFVQAAITSEIQLCIRKIRGIVDFVRNHTGPLRVPDSEIESIRTLVLRGTECSPHPVLATGERVRVVRGALAGVEGTLVRYAGHFRLVVSVEIIHRAVSINVAVSDVERILQIPVLQEPRFGCAVPQ